MSKYIEQVREFHETFEHPIGADSSHNEPLKIRQLRIKLLFEELTELAEAGDVKKTMATLCEQFLYKLSQEMDYSVLIDGDNVNKLEELDALADIQYVLSGKILTSGLHSIFDAAFDLVHQNNMSKGHDTKEEAMKTAEALQDGKDNWCTIIERNGKHIVYNRDKKVIKPWNHKKVELSL